MTTPREPDADAIEQAIVAERFRTTIELHAVGVEIMRSNLRRRHPNESADQIGQRLANWLAEQPDFGPDFVDSTAERRHRIEAPLDGRAA